MSRPRLSRSTLSDLGLMPAQVRGPAAVPGEIGIVHLGIGAFHRAHQAVYTEDAAVLTGEDGWGILGVTGRTASVVEQLRPQDGLYGVLCKGREETSLRVIGSVLDAAWPAEESERVVATIAAATTHIVSLTVTEKGYHRGPDGAIDLAHPCVAADLDLVNAELGSPARGGARDGASRTPIGLLTRALARRFRQHGAPITVVTCDNMVDNGAVLARLVGSLATAAVGEAAGRFQDWVHGSVSFPATMVDRIVPAATDAHRAEGEALLGLADAALVVAEPFSQWVVQDAFAGPRPAWDRAGATLTDDVAPYERTKLRMLNGTHSLLAYLGALRGHRLIADAVGAPELARAARALMDEDVMPTLTPPPGQDLAAYRDSVLERFANPNTGHTTIQVAMDGSQKLPIRWLATAAERLAAGAVPDATALAVAAWMVFVARGRSTEGRELPLDDPMASQLREAAAGPLDTLAERMLGLSAIFPADVAGHDGFRAAVTRHVRDLGRRLA